MLVRVVALTGLLVACERTRPASSTPSTLPTPAPHVCEELRVELTAVAREEVDHVHYTATLPEEVKRSGVAAIVDAEIAVCVSDRWTATQVACFLKMDPEADCGIPKVSRKRMFDAADAVWTHAFGIDEELEQFAREQEALMKAYEEEKAKSAE